MKITESKIRRIIREELNRSLLVEGLPLLVLAPGVAVTAGELAASAGVSLYVAYMWLQSQDGYDGPTYETPENMASDLNISVEDVLSPDYVGRGPSQPHGGFDPSQVGGSPPGPMQSPTGGRPQRGSPGYREYEEALREKEVIIARAREEISEMDIDIDTILNLNVNEDQEEQESEEVRLYCMGLKPMEADVELGPYNWLYYTTEAELDNAKNTFCRKVIQWGRLTDYYGDALSRLGVSNAIIADKRMYQLNPKNSVDQQYLIRWASINYPDADILTIEDYANFAEPYCGMLEIPFRYSDDDIETYTDLAYFYKSLSSDTITLELR